MKTVGLISSYREGRLLLTAIRSLLACCDVVYVLDAPIIDAPASGEESVFWHRKTAPPELVVWRDGIYSSDADKRSELLNRVKQRQPGPLWGVVLDGDEVLLWPELLPDYLAHADSNGHTGKTIKVVFEDGQVYESSARLLRIDLIERYILSSYQFALKDYTTAWVAPIIPASKPPMQGEPHILHRGYLRAGERNAPAERMSRRELDELATLGIR